MLDCGAGIGRNTVDVLGRLRGVETVDLLEPSDKLREYARKHLGGHRCVGTFFSEPLQEFIASKDYDLVWLQWVLMYIPDSDVVSFLTRCRLRMPSGSRIVVKENIEDRSVEEDLDLKDLCLTRTVAHFEKLFTEAGFRVAVKRRQKDWPTSTGLFPVMMWCLAPLS